MITLVGRTLKFFENSVMIRSTNAFGEGESKALVEVMTCDPVDGGAIAIFKDFKLKLGQ